MSNEQNTPAGQAFLDLRKEAKDWLGWFARRRAAECTSPVERDRLLRDELAPLVARLGPVAREQYAKTLAEILTVSAAVVRRSIKEALDAREAGESSSSAADSSQGEAGIIPAGAEESRLEAVRDFGERHFKVWMAGNSWVGRETEDEDGRRQVDFVEAGALTRYYSHVKIRVWSPKDRRMEARPLAKEWLDWAGLRSYERVVFRPGREARDDSYNIFRGWSVEPRQGDASPFWDHVHRVVCAGKEEVYRYVRRWMAHTVQRPWEVPQVALVLRGLQGTGKGAFVEMFSRILDPYTFNVVSMDQPSSALPATASFSAWLTASRLLR